MLSQSDWFTAVCASYSAPPVAVEGQVLPGFPSDLIQTNTTGQAGVPTLKEAFVFYQDCVDMFESLGAGIKTNNSLLDFGVGWGRIARFFLRDLPKANIFGVDVMQEFVEICKAAFGNENFLLTTPFPPSKFPKDKFNYIVGYSVFSHLSEDACRSWMQEFHRITAPNGILALTTRSRQFMDFCESLKAGDQTGYLEALSRIFKDFAVARKLYDSGQFVHSNVEGVNGGGAMNSEFYGETFIPETYARTAYSEFFTLEKFLFDPLRQTHPIMFFRKKSQ
jgi:ubiquinone/menaquinone biosynthesis C-methylase UbiE